VKKAICLNEVSQRVLAWVRALFEFRGRRLKWAGECKGKGCRGCVDHAFDWEIDQL
jgi:hypothetical protein